MKKTFIAALVICCTALSVQAQLTVSSNGNVTVSGELRARQFQPSAYQGWTQMSTIYPALKVVDYLSPVSYKKNGPVPQGIMLPTHLRYGIPANNLHTYMPDLTTGDGLSITMVNYDELVPLLLQAVKELKARVFSLNALLGIAEDDEESYSEEKYDRENSRQQFMSRAALPDRLEGAVLYQNRPNPFSSQTEINFRLPDDTQEAFIYIFDMTGKTVKQIAVGNDKESITIDGYELSPGMYLYSLIVNGQEISTKRMILSK